MISRDEFERVFDATDADNAEGLGFRALKLLHVCQRILDAHNGGLRVGRDDATELAVTMRDVAKHLGFYELVDSNTIHDRLSDRRESKVSKEDGG